MGSGSEKGESVATDPRFAMYHQLSLLTGSLPLDRAARQKRTCHSGCRGTPVAFPPFLLSKRGIHGQYNATDCHHRRNPASRWWRLVWAGTLVLSHSLAPADEADSGFQLRSANSDPQASICLTEALAFSADSCPVTSIASSLWSLLNLALGRQRTTPARAYIEMRAMRGRSTVHSSSWNPCVSGEFPDQCLKRMPRPPRHPSES
jgi:hypothetical protein